VKRKKKKGKTWVKTVYSPDTFREPDISEYDTKEEAELIVKTCLQWGIGIVSCEIIPEEQALEERNLFND